MTEAERVFSRYAPFIREYIYREGWEELRDAQLDAARVIFESEDNLLLLGPTASGKTEAAFFPIISDIFDNPPAVDSVTVLYVAPLKSLINDQFLRMQELLDESHIRVTHWHGDASQADKQKLLKKPSGILQITPESLESMLMHRGNDVTRIFASLRYVVLDEIHTLIGSDRGNQVIAQLVRLSRLIGHSPRRIGLSATIGDPSLAAAWLGAGSGRETAVPPPPDTRLRWRLAYEHFYIQNPNLDQRPDTAAEVEGRKPKRAILDPGYEFLYDAMKEKKGLIFSNSREETEYVTATLRQIARKRGERDIFLIHHGNLSAALREDAERRMKDADEQVITCATVTMELGVDIGRLERVAQVDAPTSVAGFLQRLGRSGRRGDPPEMIEVFREETPLPNAPLPELIPWGLLRAIAITQLYTEERFVEPPRLKKLPFSLAFQQTLSTLASSGELSARALAERILPLPPFANIPKEDYRALLLSMLENDFLELTEEKGLIVGLAGERLINSYRFCAVFQDSVDHTVRSGSDEIGTITNPPPVGDRFALAGRVWEVTELDLARRLVYAEPVEGKMEISWPGDGGEIHTRVLEKMRDVLFGDQTYPYLMPNATARLDTARHLARNTGMHESMLIPIGGSSFCLFPWLGTRAFRTLKRLLLVNASALGISELRTEGCCYMTFKAKREDGKLFLARLCDLIRREEGIDTDPLVQGLSMLAYDKYDAHIPDELLRRAYAADRLSPEEVTRRFVPDIKTKTR